jgi:hypothetical protein
MPFIGTFPQRDLPHRPGWNTKQRSSFITNIASRLNKSLREFTTTNMINIAIRS